MSNESKLDRILQDLELIKNHLKIVPNLEIEIDDYKSSVEKYEKFAKNELKLNEKTITNHLSTISRFLAHSQGLITVTTVTEFLDSNDSDSWKSNQLKALRKYLRDYLKIGNWINEFNFTKSKAKLKDELPDNDQLARFCSVLPYEMQMVFLVIYTSGLRIGEVLSLRCSNYYINTCMIDASNIHTGNTKSSWISFISTQAAEYFNSYFQDTDIDNDGLIFHQYPNGTKCIQVSF